MPRLRIKRLKTASSSALRDLGVRFFIALQTTVFSPQRMPSSLRCVRRFHAAADCIYQILFSSFSPHRTFCHTRHESVISSACRRYGTSLFCGKGVLDASRKCECLFDQIPQLLFAIAFAVQDFLQDYVDCFLVQRLEGILTHVRKGN